MSPEQLDRTIDFILQSQALAEARWEKAEARWEKAEARQDRLDRRVDGIAKIVQQGMRLLVKAQTEAADARVRQRKMDKTLAELAQAQKATEQSLRAFINSQRGSRNGH